MASARENLAPQVIQRVAREIRKLVQSPPDGIRYLPQEEEVLTEIHVEIAGPENTPYDGAFFQVKLSLSDGFPHAPPKGVFLTKIFHPNISTSGEICVNTLKKDWSQDLGIAHVLQVIRCLLIVPFPESSLNDEAGKLFMESYEEYARRAKIWTNIHAPKRSAVKKPEIQKLGTRQSKTTSEDNQESMPVVKTALEKKPQHQSDGQDVSTYANNVNADQLATGEETGTTTKPTPTVAVGTSSTIVPPLTKKRPSPTSMDAQAAQKKKQTLKKGIKRL